MVLCIVSMLSARHLAKNVMDEPTPQAMLRHIRPIQTGLFQPALGPMTRNIKASTEHLASARQRRQRIVAAIVDCELLADGTGRTCKASNRVGKLTFDAIAHSSGVVIELNFASP